RDIWFGALAAAAVLTRLPPESTTRHREFGRLILATLAALALTRPVWHIGPGAGRTPSAVNAAAYPAGAAPFLQSRRPPGSLFNDLNWGGSLIWAAPEYPVGLDGRTNLYGEERLDRAFRAWLGDADADPDLSAAGVVLAPRKLGRSEVPLTNVLRSDSRWRVAYEDDVAVVFVPVRSP